MGLSNEVKVTTIKPIDLKEIALYALTFFTSAGVGYVLIKRSGKG